MSDVPRCIHGRTERQRCRACNEMPDHATHPALDGPSEPASGPYLPPRIAVDAKGFYWRDIPADDEIGVPAMWSMCPTDPDNSPIPEPVTYYVPESALAAEREKVKRLREALGVAWSLREGQGEKPEDLADPDFWESRDAFDDYWVRCHIVEAALAEDS